MSHLSTHWYSKFSSTGISQLPRQAIPFDKKDEKWQKKCLDALETEGLKQFRDNLKFNDYYRMSSGKISFMELAEVMPQYRELDKMLDEMSMPNTIKHFDLLGIVNRHLENIIINGKDTLHPVNVDEFGINDREQKLSELLQNYVAEQWQKTLTIKMLQSGFNPTKTEFSSEEEKAAYIQELEQRTEALTPPQIKKYLKEEWKPTAIMWAEIVIEGDEVRKGVKSLRRENVKDYLRTGRCFRHFYETVDGYEIERWSPINTFFSQTIDAKYPQYGEYIGRVHFFTPSDYINRRGHTLTEKQQERILNTGTSHTEYETDGFGFGFENNFQHTVIAPHANYFDQQLITSLEDELGLPLSVREIYKKDGTTETLPSFSPRYNTTNSRHTMAQYLRGDLNLRTDMICVTEVYWRSYQKYGLVKYQNEFGTVETTLITDEIIKSFLKENEIETLKELTLEQALKEQPINSVVWFYVPQIWKGEKATTSTTDLGEDIYTASPLAYQIKGDSNLFNMQLPVAGLISENPSEKILPYQHGYNIAMNEQFNLMEKEIGVLFAFDVRFIPDDLKEKTDTETSLYNMISVIKDTSLFAVDASTQNLGKTGNAFNQWSVHDLTLTNHIAAKQQQAEYFKQKAFEQYGLNPQILQGEAVKYQTKAGVDTVNNATRSQTDYMYDEFLEFEARAAEIQIALAQYAQSEGKDVSLEYSKSDLTRAWLDLADPTISLRRYGVMFTSDSKRRMELEQYKQYIFSQNTLDTDSAELLEIISSDNLITLKRYAQLERERKVLEAEKARQHELAMLQQQYQLDNKKELSQWVLQEITNQRDRINKLYEERINALGRAADKKAEPSSFNNIKDVTEASIKATKVEGDIDAKLKSIDLERDKLLQDFETNKEKQQLEKEKLRLKEKEIENNRYIAEINKN